MAKVVKIKKGAKVISTIPVVKRIEPEAELPEKYITVLKSNPLHQQSYSRLMIIYRKLRQYRKELAIINKAIKAFEQIYQSKKTNNKQIQSISRQLNRQLGLTDSKGRSTYPGQPIAGWKKRKEIVLKKLEEK